MDGKLLPIINQLSYEVWRENPTADRKKQLHVYAKPIRKTKNVKNVFISQSRQENMFKGLGIFNDEAVHFLSVLKDMAWFYDSVSFRIRFNSYP